MAPMLQPVIYWHCWRKNAALRNSATNSLSLHQFQRVLWSLADDDPATATDRLHRKNVSASVGNLHPQRNSGSGASRTRTAHFLPQATRRDGCPGERRTD